MDFLDTSVDLATLFRRQVEATPEAVAAEDATSSWTYAELDAAAERVGLRLRSSFGVGRDVLVGVLMGRSVQYVVACLAAIKAGGAFLVLEVAYPAGLLADVIDDARPAVVITSPSTAAQVPAGIAAFSLGDGAAMKQSWPLGPSWPSTPLQPLPNATDIDRLAFVSYSSGTTGRPKGIANPHSAAVRSYNLRFCFSDVAASDRVACNVFFVWEILRPLLRGATTVTVPDETSYDPVGLVEFLAAHAITETLMTPTLLATVLARYPADLAARLPRLRTLWLNGEVVTVDLARRALAALPPWPAARLLNCYSASETHEIACCDLATIFPTDATVCPAGVPLDPAHTYILSDAEHGADVGVGVSGELFVGGGLLARGYLNRPETTAAVFLPDRFDDTTGARMYRTGDRARRLPSGALEISGRVGGMIKLRGYTVQPAAVEAAIVKHLAVRSCVVLGVGEGLSRQLVAYVVRDETPVGGPEDRPGDPRSRARLDIDADGRSPLARRLLAAHLAHYMVPVVWVPLEVLPTHKVSGKIDVKGLPPLRLGLTPPETPRDGSVRGDVVDASEIADVDTVDTVSNVSSLTADVSRHWAACLGVEPLAVTADFDFFDLGGHSLALADLASRLSRAYGVTVPLIELARNPTLNGHVQAVQAARAGFCGDDDDVAERLRARLEEDCLLPDDIRAAESPATPTPISQADHILLTGATGFLGASLLDALITHTTATIFCLVRTTREAPSGMARLRRHLLDLGLWHDAMADRIEIVSGDLAQPRLGLTPPEFDQLAVRVQAIIHAGAAVNLVYPYDALRDANVGGTREVLRLAAAAAKGEASSAATVHFVSTNGVLPPATAAWPENAHIDAADAAIKLADGYCQTKWVAEQLVSEAAARRGIPARIYRPGTLGGHSRSGASNPRDVVTALIVESLRLGRSPPANADADWRVEMTPVDFASEAIVALADTSDSTTIFHVGDPDGLSSTDLFARLATLGYPTSPAGSWNEWVALWNARQGAAAACAPAPATAYDDPSPADILRSGMPSADFFRAATLLDDSCTQSLLRTCRDDGPIVRPSLDLALLRTYTRHFYSRGWLAKGPIKTAFIAGADTTTPVAKPVLPLAGRVAVVVGASSGIGAAIATALVRDGAHVAIAARRVDVLKNLQQKLECEGADHGSKVLAHAADVTDAAQVDALVAAAVQQLGGPVDILVVCAGVMYFTMMASARADEWTRTVDVNCKGLLHCLAATVPAMTQRGTGHIVAISSDAGRKVFPGLGVYSGSKFFVEAVLQSLRVETAASGLRVTSVQPGNTATDLLALSTDPEAMEKYGAPTGAKVLDPEDVASAVIYALRQPAHVAVNEVLIEPREEPI
ncbi:hybrid NRPS/PKS enzyme [Grosmannia clavigera kw1407]|uniref:Hybrid NRPS/PKS enzyme n=1 Tax=Grosmannia clavigera (strain kw1407 / UAMH 11150) TaxID=655863 RepID=F0X8P2_GROCL|nr:hybrid NRPS/PKS enzyme [Grosmannia clavigera kw1407]EFX05547.1 hybrid NRPS/PKS enzyme [Grosmannia clavigera kw1407]